MERIILIFFSSFFISCSSLKKVNNGYIESQIKDLNSFDILIKKFAHNIENIWGFNEVLIAGPKNYVKYTDSYRTRSHINFEEGLITLETIIDSNPLMHLRQMIIKTLLMSDNPSSIKLYSNINDIQISKEPFFYGQILDQKGQPIYLEERAKSFADYLLKTRLKKRNNNFRIIYSVTIDLVENHLDKRARKYMPLIHKASKKYKIDKSLILAIIQIESSFRIE